MRPSGSRLGFRQLTRARRRRLEGPPSGQLGASEHLERFCFRRRTQDVAHGQRLLLRKPSSSNLFGSLREVVGRTSQLHPRSKQEPIRSRWCGKWHPNATGIHYSYPSDRAVKLHVRMATDDHRRVDLGEHRRKSLLVRHSREALGVVTGRGMAEQYFSQSWNLDVVSRRPVGHKPLAGRRLAVVLSSE